MRDGLCGKVSWVRLWQHDKGHEPPCKHRPLHTRSRITPMAGTVIMCLCSDSSSAAQDGCTVYLVFLLRSSEILYVHLIRHIIGSVFFGKFIMLPRTTWNVIVAEEGEFKKEEECRLNALSLRTCWVDLLTLVRLCFLQLKARSSYFHSQLIFK